jgi:hypothetical protein
MKAALPLLRTLANDQFVYEVDHSKETLTVGMTSAHDSSVRGSHAPKSEQTAMQLTEESDNALTLV